ncbi:MAG: hypothetical protein ACMVY4_19075 [Minwuia sp.]|uniref:hypothetical protein n=1 Tax=Minwuia sp. TaxID=2493630 RepID=UPI003A84A0BA
MELLRDDQVVAINDVLVALYDLMEVLHAARDEAREAEDVDDALGVSFGERAERLSEQARRLGAVVERLGDSPAGPSDERLIFDQAGVRLKASLSHDTASALHNSISNAERNLSAAIETALPDIRDEEAREIVEALKG